MKVVAVIGKAKPQHTLYYPADKKSTELPQKVQQGLQALGEVVQSHEIDLTGRTDAHSKNIVKGIEAEGAYLSKRKIEITESMVQSSRVPGKSR